MNGRGIPRMPGLASPPRRPPRRVLRRIGHCAAATLVLAGLSGPGFADTPQAVPNGAGAVSEPDGEQEAGLGPEEVAELQRLLDSLDFHAGPADGVPGPRTRAGIKAFQQSAGLEADGEPTPALLAKIREHAREAPGAGESQAGSAPAEPARQPLPARDGLAGHVAAALHSARSASADPAVIRTLRKAHRRLQRRALTRIFDTDFFGAERVPGPWRMAGKGFALHSRLGMRAGGDGRSAVLRAVQDAWTGLSAAVGLSDGAAEAAELYAPQPFAGPFELKVGFRLTEDAGQLVIGPYRGASRTDGYRFVYSPGDGHRLAVFRVENGRETPLAGRLLPIRLNTGILHELTWWRTGSGRMELAIGGTELFSIRDDRAGAAFDGLTITARNGGFSIAHVQLRAAPPGQEAAAAR